MSETLIPTEVRRVDVGDAEIHTEITGDGPDLFLVAGLGGRGAFWTKQVQFFARLFRVITFDHRGCGESTPDKVVYGAEHMADDVLALMDAMQIERANLIGHSTGGAIGQHIALKAPQRLEKLVLSCSWAGPDTYLTELFRTRREILISCGPLAYLTIGTYLAMPSRHLQPQMKSARAFMEERLAAFPGLEVELSRINAVYTHDLRSRLHQIAVPTFCIGAMDDQLTPPGFTEEMARLIPGAEKHLADHGGHFCPMVVPDVYNPRVLEFLKN
ncbi:alpha/beta fold hydrolase [Altererythrobacter sp. BO-6]|uniref:alpha/beta fold hydrolase n=1 Tax=Altererythrobacter sp. BO-6 TaxID=2604537 RepID=UPI0013E1450D|nr:alpha/beta fold hydrolase [Altererythrobacter sp. BO-6]QIG53619.1 alpha/beta fold hydrolase [Altererythrobacter sp. BO-6]